MSMTIQCPCCGSTVKDIRETIEFGRFIIDLHSYKCNEVQLTPREFDILIYLVLNRGRILTRTQIINRVYGVLYQGLTNNVDVYVRYIRIKLGQDVIKTARGIGYIFNS